MQVLHWKQQISVPSKCQQEYEFHVCVQLHVAGNYLCHKRFLNCRHSHEMEMVECISTTPFRHVWLRAKMQDKEDTVDKEDMIVLIFSI